MSESVGLSGIPSRRFKLKCSDDYDDGKTVSHTINRNSKKRWRSNKTRKGSVNVIKQRRQDGGDQTTGGTTRLMGT